ncbi:glycoside hydrolase TIM-barrel-like domain-containing protein [Candidatus Tisiphia endosymbiont of Ptychoptera albimana]|uniref:baseplate megatron protein TIM-barrel domain-containing protein n=1 Tax=Candidatus Tisiphia endosymbiont of Ptychoptera albimana TaxID=3066260 RepID=UPI001DDB25C3|nr:glycoside hydrolase TIM-barrel-like domain-containing protein [Rickettsia endosymbiont of Sericostoma sp. HW-2014]
MFSQILGNIGSSIGGVFGGGILSTIGRFAGKTLGDYLEYLNHQPEEYYHFKNIRESFVLSKAVYGHPIALVFGTARVNGKIIWANQIKEVQITSVAQPGVSDTQGTAAIHNLTECEYYLSFAVGICEGEIAEISRVWANDQLLNLEQYTFRLYLGSEEQIADPLIAATDPQGQVPAFRGLSYAVFEELPLADFNNSIPNFSFEVTRKANIPSYVESKSVEDLVEAVDIIPGSGEFVYDCLIQYKTITNSLGGIISKKPINSNNYHNIADSVYSLDQMKIICPNIKWVAPVVCWFGDSLDIKNCIIKPAVEFNDPHTQYSEQWQVGKYSRDTARLVSRDADNFPKYGGTVNDASIIRYLQELKRRNFKIMFYPMFFLDIWQKPWRGHLTGSISSVVDFFNKDQGYNDFILHYAELVKDHIDSFVIGSELIGLTSIRDQHNNFPAVMELIKLAKLVKNIVGDNVLVTYAADWSEYHHTKDGWYNLDKLFASEYIDFVGIDAYFPVTRTVNSRISSEEIIKGWQSGEGYDYFVDDNNSQRQLSEDYAWKNLRYWWENYHRNPDGITTEWQPKMKKIWFTEFGFPSIDKATNQPNIFFDPLCIDGGVPKYSTGEVDFSIQRKAIRGFIEYWQTQEYIEQMFLWTWDARPYPAWPHNNIWRDGNLWAKGHWVNNKFGACNLAAIILELSYRCNIPLKNIDISTLDEAVEGLVLNKALSCIDIINSLRIIYFFDIIAYQEQIKFTKRGYSPLCKVSSKILVKLSSNSYLEQMEISKTSIISKLGLNFIDRCDNYNNGFCQINSENFSHRAIPVLRLPIILSCLEAERLGQLILKNAATETKILRFIMPANFIKYQPGDFVLLYYRNYQYQIRIISMKLSRLTVEIQGIIDEVENYVLGCCLR